MWEYFSIELNAAELRDPQEEHLTDLEMARRLSEAIIHTVQHYKTEGCQLVNMEFNAGQVVINFRVPLEN